MKVKLIKKWMNHKKGEVLNLSNDFAPTLIDRKTAICVDPLYGGTSKVRRAPNKMMKKSPVQT